MNRPQQCILISKKSMINHRRLGGVVVPRRTRIYTHHAKTLCSTHSRGIFVPLKSDGTRLLAWSNF